MREVNLKVTEELYEIYRKIGIPMDSSAEEVMEMMLRVCATHIQRKKEETHNRNLDFPTASNRFRL